MAFFPQEFSEADTERSPNLHPALPYGTSLRLPTKAFPAGALSLGRYRKVGWTPWPAYSMCLAVSGLSLLRFCLAREEHDLSRPNTDIKKMKSKPLNAFFFLSTELRESTGWGRLDIWSADLYNTSHPPAGEGPTWPGAGHGAGCTEPLEVAPPWAGSPTFKRLTSFIKLFVLLLNWHGIPSINSLSLSQLRELQAVPCTHLSCSSFLCSTKVHCLQTWISETESWWFLIPKT